MKQQKQDRRSVRTRHLIGTALIDLLGEKRYDAITVQDILERANIGRSTFYAHYFDKEDVLASTFEQVINGLSQQIQQGEAGQGLLPSLELFRHAQQQHQLYQAIVRGHGGEVIWKTGQTFLSRRIEQVLATEASGKRPPSVPLSVVSQYLAGAFLNLLKWWLEAEMPYSPERMDELFQRLALPGVWATVEGSK